MLTVHRHAQDAGVSAAVRTGVADIYATDVPLQLIGQICLPIKVTPNHVLEPIFLVLLAAANVSYFIFSLCICTQLRSSNYFFLSTVVLCKLHIAK